MSIPALKLTSSQELYILPKDPVAPAQQTPGDAHVVYARKFLLKEGVLVVPDPESSALDVANGHAVYFGRKPRSILARHANVGADIQIDSGHPTYYSLALLPIETGWGFLPFDYITITQHSRGDPAYVAHHSVTAQFPDLVSGRASIDRLVLANRASVVPLHDGDELFFLPNNFPTLFGIPSESLFQTLEDDISLREVVTKVSFSYVQAPASRRGLRGLFAETKSI